MTSSEKISEDAIFRVGKVVAVEGRVVKVRVDKTKNSSYLVFKGDLLKNVAVGGYVKIVKGFTRIIGKVEGEFITEDKRFEQKSYASDKEKINRVLSLSLLGFFKGQKFERGIKELPLIDNECFLLYKKEFDQVHHFVKKGDDPLTIGTLALEKGQEIQIGVNGLFASHIGIFGNTGSGKSYTLAKIYRELFLKYGDNRKFKSKAEFFLIDFNGEYTADASNDDIIVSKAYKRCFRLSTRTHDGDKFPITTETLADPEFWIIFLEATAKTQAPFLRRALVNDFLPPRISDEERFKELIGDLIVSATAKNDRNVDKGVVVDFLRELSAALEDNPSILALAEDFESHLQWHTMGGKFLYQPPGEAAVYCDTPNYRATVVDPKTAHIQIDVAAIAAIDAVRIRIVVQYYTDIIRGFANREHLSPLIKRLDKRIDDLEKVIVVEGGRPRRRRKNFTVVSLLDVNIHMRKILPLLFCKMLYTAKKDENNPSNYLNLIVDEAHNILSESSERESEQWKDYRLETFEEIIKEGRKFGVFLTIASQRPSDISPTIISQLHNYFLHRLINNEDIRAVEKTISYLDKVSFEYLPILPTGTCIVAGLLANIPVVVDIGKIYPAEHEPKNKTITLTENWK
jgi:DNA helicase HerA-like ATPase